MASNGYDGTYDKNCHKPPEKPVSLFLRHTKGLTSSNLFFHQLILNRAQIRPSRQLK